jgi:hypothetical protein
MTMMPMTLLLMLMLMLMLILPTEHSRAIGRLRSRCDARRREHFHHLLSRKHSQPDSTSSRVKEEPMLMDEHKANGEVHMANEEARTFAMMTGATR